MLTPSPFPHLNLYVYIKRCSFSCILLFAKRDKDEKAHSHIAIVVILHTLLSFFACFDIVCNYNFNFNAIKCTLIYRHTHTHSDTQIRAHSIHRFTHLFPPIRIQYTLHSHILGFHFIDYHTLYLYSQYTHTHHSNEENTQNSKNLNTKRARER